MKYYLVNNHEEVKVGQSIGAFSLVDTPFGEAETCQRITLTEENLPVFIEKGIIVATENPEVSPFLSDYVSKYCQRVGWNGGRFKSVFSDICSVNPAPLFSILLKEIAIAMDRLHKGHVSEAEQQFFISLEDGRIHKAIEKFSNIKYIAVFRSAAEAEEALTILEPLHREMFPELYGEPKNKECHSKGV